jgi:hypothetical protein
VAVAGVRRIRVEPEAGSPVVTDPELVGVEQLSDVMVLHAGEVPHQPGDRVRVRRRSFGQPAEVDTDDGVSRQRWDAPVELEKQRSNVHTAIPSWAPCSSRSGASVVGFAFTELLGFRMLPRLKDIDSMRLYRPDDAGTYPTSAT